MLPGIRLVVFAVLATIVIAIVSFAMAASLRMARATSANIEASLGPTAERRFDDQSAWMRAKRASFGQTQNTTAYRRDRPAADEPVRLVAIAVSDEASPRHAIEHVAPSAALIPAIAVTLRQSAGESVADPPVTVGADRNPSVMSADWIAAGPADRGVETTTIQIPVGERSAESIGPTDHAITSNQTRRAANLTIALVGPDTDRGSDPGVPSAPAAPPAPADAATAQTPLQATAVAPVGELHPHPIAKSHTRNRSDLRHAHKRRTRNIVSADARDTVTLPRPGGTSELRQSVWPVWHPNKP